MFRRQDLAAAMRVFLRNRTVRLGSGNTFSNNKAARRLSKASCMVVHIRRGWMVSIILFDPGLKTRCVLVDHEGPHLRATSVFTTVLPLPSCNDIVSVSPPCDRVLMDLQPGDIPSVGVGPFEVRL